MDGGVDPLILQGVHVRLEGFTASFRHPLLISGTQASLPVPAYTNVLGMISACAGRAVMPREVRVGFEYRHHGQAFDLQTTRRWTLQGGRLRQNPKGTGLLRRQFHVRPRLDLYVVPDGMRAVFESPVATPRFGRSEDVAWIAFVRAVSLAPVAGGAIGATLVARDAVHTPGLPLTLAEWFETGSFGKPRRAGAIGRFIGLPPTPDGLRFHAEGSHLFHPSDAEAPEDAVYLHAWAHIREGM